MADQCISYFRVFISALVMSAYVDFLWSFLKIHTIYLLITQKQ